MPIRCTGCGDAEFLLEHSARGLYRSVYSHGLSCQIPITEALLLNGPLALVSVPVFWVKT